jgi:hypothetical protein
MGWWDGWSWRLPARLGAPPVWGWAVVPLPEAGWPAPKVATSYPAPQARPDWPALRGNLQVCPGAELRLQDGCQGRRAPQPERQDGVLDATGERTEQKEELAEPSPGSPLEPGWQTRVASGPLPPAGVPEPVWQPELPVPLPFHAELQIPHCRRYTAPVRRPPAPWPGRFDK